MSIAILGDRVISMSVSKPLLHVSRGLLKSYQAANLEICLGPRPDSSPDQQPTSDEDKGIDNGLILCRVALETSGKDIGVLCVLADGQIVAEAELTVAVVAGGLFGGRLAGDVCQGDDCAVAETCAFAKGCGRWGNGQSERELKLEKGESYRRIELAPRGQARGVENPVST